MSETPAVASCEAESLRVPLSEAELGALPPTLHLCRQSLDRNLRPGRAFMVAASAA